MRGIGPLFAVALVLGSCAPAARPVSLAGRYRIASGGGALTIVQALTQKFSQVHPEVVWDIENVGSDAAVAGVKDGDSDLGSVSRELTGAEDSQVDKVVIGVSGTAVAVNAANPLTGLTKEQIRAIFSGAAKTWTAVGGTSTEIRVFVREPTSATREVFDSFVFDGKPQYRPDAIPVDSKAQTLQALHSFRGAVSMLTLETASLSDPQVRLLAVDGVPATLENLASGTYRMRRPLYLVYSPSPSKVKPAVAAFIEFVRGPEGQSLIAGK